MEEKKRIKPVIEVVDGEQMPSLDSVSQNPQEEVSETLEEKISDPVGLDSEGETSTILSEETKDEPEEVKVEQRPMERNDIGIVQPPSEPQEKKSKLTFVLVTILVALVVALLAGGIYVY